MVSLSCLLASGVGVLRLQECTSGTPIEIGLEHTPFVVLVYFFPHLNMQKPADYGPQQH